MDAIAESLGPWGSALASLAAAVGALALIWSKVLRPSWRSLMDLHAALKAAAEVVQAQLNPNGGGSLIDKMDGLIKATATHSELLAHHTAQLTELEAQMAQHEHVA